MAYLDEVKDPAGYELRPETVQGSLFPALVLWACDQAPGGEVRLEAANPTELGRAVVKVMAWAADFLPASTTRSSIANVRERLGRLGQRSPEEMDDLIHQALYGDDGSTGPIDQETQGCIALDFSEGRPAVVIAADLQAAALAGVLDMLNIRDE